MLTKQQINILSVFKQDIFASLTFKQIKEKSKQKSNNVVQIAIKEFQSKKLILTQKIGDISMHRLNLNNNDTFSYLEIINQEEINKSKIPKEVIAEIQKKIEKYTEFFVLIIFGSYAKNKATSKSDLDISILVDSKQARKEIIPGLETIKRRETIPIDYHVFTRSEFLEMLKSEMENVGKQIVKKRIIYYGCIPYYHLIKRQKK